MKSSFPFYRQYDTKDCGPACLKMIVAFYGKNISLSLLREHCKISKSGVSLLGIEHAAKFIGFDPISTISTPIEFFSNHILPCIVHWNKDHFVVVYKIDTKYVYVADPGKAKVKFSKQEFIEGWTELVDGEQKGIALFLENGTEIMNIPEESLPKEISLKKLYRSIFKFKGLVTLLFTGILLGSLLQTIFPFLTKAILDIGVKEKSLYFISVILSAQLMLFLGQITIDFIRRWILLFISTRVNLTILTDFLKKLMKLPVSFFDTKHVGDMMQRLNDHNRIETFLTGASVSSIFSVVTLIVFGAILAFYNFLIFCTFLIGSLIYVAWVALFLKKRKTLDILKFEYQAKNQSKVVELIGGMQDIKLNMVPNKKRWEWEQIQANLFNLNSRLLKLNQVQEIGANSINQLKNIVIIFLSAKSVINGQLSLGEMLSIQYIMGQLNSPIDQLMSFIQAGQEAELSIDRLNEVHQLQNEEDGLSEQKPENIPSGSIGINNVSFMYPGVYNNEILKDITLNINEGEITAVVGASGSGKTTLIKLMLMIYKPDKGRISVGVHYQSDFSYSSWRSNCGTVLQDGYIFSDTIANNIGLDEKEIDTERLKYAASVANITEYIMGLPLKFETVIGNEGNGLSQGQKQRILIARAVYKNPCYIFFDEATNALDASNESIIMKNLNTFFSGKTVVIVAHRLSTVKNAKQIIVLNKGVVAETGTHSELIRKRGYYYSLIKDQLELDA